MASRRRLGPVLLAASLVTAPVGLSRGAPAGDDHAFLETSNELRRRGQALYKNKEFAKARAAFVAAWALRKHWELAEDLAFCEVQLGLYRDAAEHFAIALREMEELPEDDVLFDVYSWARTKLGTLDVSVIGEGAAVLLDGKYVGRDPLKVPLFVEPGRHAVEALLAGRTKMAVLDVEAGQTRRIVLSLGIEPGQPSVVIVDDEWRDWDGVAAKSSRDVQAGNGAAREAGATAAPAAAVATPPPDAVVLREGQPNGYLVAGGTAAGGAAVGTGVALAFLSAAAASDADRLLARLKAGGVRCAGPPQPRGCAEVLALRQEQDRWANTAVAALIGGGVLWAATAAYTFWPRPAAEPAVAAWAAPAVMPYGVGFSVGGEF